MATAQELKNYIDSTLPSNNKIKMSLLRTVLKYLIDGIATFTGSGGGIAEIKDKLVEVGQIGSLTLSAYINANDSSDWNMLVDTTYIYQCVRDGLLENYLYVGTKPKYLGNTQAASIMGDFKLLSQSRLHIDGAEVEKANNNSIITTLQSGDIVYWKTIAEGPQTLLGWTYDGGDEDVLANYTQNQSINI